MTRTRRYFSPQDKVDAVRRHLLEKVPVSDLCDELSIAPTMFYQWQKTFFENGVAAFETKRLPAVDPKDKTITVLQQKVTEKNEVIAELLAEHVKLKKANGEP